MLNQNFVFTNLRDNFQISHSKKQKYMNNADVGFLAWNFEIQGIKPGLSFDNLKKESQAQKSCPIFIKTMLSLFGKKQFCINVYYESFQNASGGQKYLSHKKLLIRKQVIG